MSENETTVEAEVVPEVDAAGAPDDPDAAESHTGQGPETVAETQDEAEVEDGGLPEIETDDPVDDVAELVEVDLDDVLTAATNERDEFRDQLLRLHADFDNYRKRVQKELGEAADKALGRFVEELLPVLDAVDGARAHGGDSVDQVAGLLIDLLDKQGLERVGSEGDVFDPTLHDAVLHEAGDDDVQTIDKVLRAGWRWRGRVLRPAMVKVVGG